MKKRKIVVFNKKYAGHIEARGLSGMWNRAIVWFAIEKREHQAGGWFCSNKEGPKWKREKL